MKYIRTKDGIYDFKKYCLVNTYNKVLHSLITGDDSDEDIEIIKQADTIEELCDEFVIITSTHDIYKQLSIGLIQKHIARNHKIYGAIWTDEALIYVAKMNEKGELELL